MDFSISGHFGDFDIENGDIRMISSKAEILKNTIISRIKNNHGDSYIPFGANLISFIGQSINQNLVDRIKSRIINALTSDGLIKTNQLTVIAVRSGSSIIIRIIVAYDSGITSADQIIINFTFTNDAGVSGI